MQCLDVEYGNYPIVFLVETALRTKLKSTIIWNIGSGFPDIPL